MGLIMEANFDVKVDKEVQDKSEEIFNELGLDMNTAINIFLNKTIYENGIPFDLKLDSLNQTTIEAIEEGNRFLNDPNTKSYSSIEELKEVLK